VFVIFTFLLIKGGFDNDMMLETQDQTIEDYFQFSFRQGFYTLLSLLVYALSSLDFS